MPSLSMNSRDCGPLISLAIMPVAFAPDLKATHEQNPVSLHHYMALIDTGASHTAISAKVISDLGLAPIGKQPVGGVHGQAPTNLYTFQVGLVFPQNSVSKRDDASKHFDNSDNRNRVCEYGTASLMCF